MQHCFKSTTETLSEEKSNWAAKNINKLGPGLYTLWYWMKTHWGILKGYLIDGKKASWNTVS